MKIYSTHVWNTFQTQTLVFSLGRATEGVRIHINIVSKFTKSSLQKVSKIPKMGYFFWDLLAVFLYLDCYTPLCLLSQLQVRNYLSQLAGLVWGRVGSGVYDKLSETDLVYTDLVLFQIMSPVPRWVGGQVHVRFFLAVS